MNGLLILGIIIVVCLIIFAVLMAKAPFGHQDEKLNVFYYDEEKD